MNAIVKISGKQFKVAKDTKLFVNRIDAKEGSKVSFDDVLLIDNGSKVIVGNPVVKDASVEAKVLKHLKDDKVIVFKKKRRKGYRVKNGHRQSLTEIIIEKVTEKTAKAKPAKKSEESKAPKAKKAAPKAKKAAPKAKSKK
jgi:large subunit ribosomal protein L21|tara:strand:- start:63 stop:485 length:423 start_codon:yes stop_codon:yes gene_type:complete